MNIGIDFGTGFSKVAICNLDGEVVVLPQTQAGDRSVPTAFYYDHGQGALVGFAAQQYAMENDEEKNLVSSIKMSLTDERGENSLWHVDNQSFLSWQIVASLLRGVCDSAQEAVRQSGIQENINGVVLAVPAGFTKTEINVLCDALRFPREQGGAGLPVLGLIREPVAAAWDYYSKAADPQANERVLVYDLGSQVCDVAVVQVCEGSREFFDVVSSTTLRGGTQDWQMRLKQSLMDECRKAYANCDFSAAQEQLLARVAEKVRRELCFRQSANAEYQTCVDGKAVNVTTTVRRSDFEKQTGDLLGETMKLVKLVIDDSNTLDQEPIRHIICVGGGANMSMIVQSLRKLYPQINVQVADDPELSVARGAALYAQSYRGSADMGSVKMLKAPESYGIGVFDPIKGNSYVQNVIVIGDHLPVEKTHVFLSSSNNRCTRAPIRIFADDVAGERCELYQASDPNAPVYSGQMDFDESVSAGARYRCVMNMDVQGILRVKVLDEANNVVWSQPKTD
ncbi:Hsp70 family protein [Bifidobacterium sp. ESL0745]|uniref:Hsp70 family protein n=1 Tax=Bifidobacterium sp. ESL0745 TaxID=2983226 RepID=UPI0023F6B41F|nr:Hsp70 family protein [Bifidobacterium sp. ESL0745]MDF7665530.1 Hsp70 family protein [Bifidobacterium sp. ESL0745]